MKNIVIVMARPDQLEIVLKNIQAGGDLNDIYKDKFTNPDSARLAWLKENLCKGRFYLIYKDKNNIGVVMLGVEDNLWNDEIVKAGYLSTFCIKKEYRGGKLGYHIMGLLKKSLKQKNFKFLRLVCRQDLPTLQRYYENYGFKKVGSAEHPDATVYKYQLEL